MATARVPRRRSLAVVGAGPKAAAIAAKAAVLNDLSLLDLELTVFDPDGIAAHWRGTNGYTDGAQQLCTLAERDVGFPYQDGVFGHAYGKAIASRMYADFSWPAYLTECGASRFSRWIDDGRRRPTHAEFADYLKWVFGVAMVTPVAERVSRIEAAPNGWRIVNDHGVAQGVFDGVVITGPGPARSLPGAPLARVFNGENFWKPAVLAQVRSILESMRTRKTLADDQDIVIAGAGGTSAAILGWLVENGARNLPIQLIAGDQAALHWRTENAFENRLFSDQVAWDLLSPKTRDDFFNRLNRGVVWQSVADRLVDASRLQIHEGRAKAVASHADGHVVVTWDSFDNSALSLAPQGPGRPWPSMQTGPVKAEEFAASLVIDATGFDASWWVNLFPSLAAAASSASLYTQAATRSLGRFLELTGSGWDPQHPVHLPGLSSQLGPGLASLMSLGTMSTRILLPYTTP